MKAIGMDESVSHSLLLMTFQQKLGNTWPVKGSDIGGRIGNYCRVFSCVCLHLLVVFRGEKKGYILVPALFSFPEKHCWGPEAGER